MYDPKSMKAEEFINHEEILDTLKYAEKNKHNKELIASLIEKARLCKGLSHREAAVLLECDIDELNQEMFKLAKEIKQKIYGNRIVMFAPLYLSNYCVNGCVYCPYHAKNKTGAIRRVNVNIAATTVENYKRLKDAGIGTYILFQETYHKENYEQLHPTGPKHNYAYHTEAMDRAMQGGIDDVGLGVLYGLNLYRYDFVGLLMHAEHLEAVFGVGPHTISVPRICPADDIDVGDFSNAISDDIFKKIVAVIRIAVPYTGMIVSTRESEASRKAALELGVSQISGASSTSVGGYVEKEPEEENTAQFDRSDTRTLDEVVNWLLELGYIPSFCTACYREGRTGDRFMSLAKTGAIANCCQPNALMTLKEYLVDYASDETRKNGERVIAEELEKIPAEKVRNIAREYISEIEGGKRDFRF